jgi:hypothetical protein
LLVSQAPHTIEAIGEAAIVATYRCKEPSITGEQNRTTLRPPESNSDDTLPESKSDDETLRTHTGPVQ